MVVGDWVKTVEGAQVRHRKPKIPAGVDETKLLVVDVSFSGPRHAIFGCETLLRGWRMRWTLQWLFLVTLGPNRDPVVVSFPLIPIHGTLQPLLLLPTNPAQPSSRDSIAVWRLHPETSC
jgi:hypothetical protein